MKKEYNNNELNNKGFSLVELVIVILVIAILALAVFAGGSVVVKKSQVSRTISDLHNFSIAVESTMNENPVIANYTTAEDSFYATTDGIVAKLNKNLPEDYRLTAVATVPTGGNISLTAAAANTANYQIFQSAKTDSWGNFYYVIFDSVERHGATNSDFYITVISAGPNAKATLGASDGLIESDDIFLLSQYENGDVTATTYNCAADQLHKWNSTAIADVAVGTAKWGAGDANSIVNF